MKWLKYVFVVYVVLILALITREWSEKPCISSSLVKRVDINGEFQFFNCSLGLSPVGYSEKARSHNLNRVRSSISNFESFLRRNHLPQPSQLLNLDIHNSNEIEAQLSREWVHSVNPKLPDLVVSIYVDLIEKIVFGHSFMDTYASPSYVFISEVDACKLKWVLNKKWSYCDLFTDTFSSQNENLKRQQWQSSLHGLSYWSLRPMLYSALVLKFYKTPLSEKKPWIQKIFSQIRNDFSDIQYMYVRLETLDSNYAKLVDAILQEVPILTPLPHLVKFEDFKSIQSVESVYTKMQLKGLRIYFANETYTTPLGFFRSSYSKKLKVEREIWVVSRLPRLSRFQLALNDRLEILKNDGEMYRAQIHVPSLNLLFKMKVLRPEQKLETFNAKIAQSWLGLNPIQVHF